jgi:hypothetical protein
MDNEFVPFGGIINLLTDMQRDNMGGMSVGDLLKVFAITSDQTPAELLCGFLNGINSFVRMTQHNPRYNCHRFNGIHVDFKSDTNVDEADEDYAVRKFVALLSILAVVGCQGQLFELKHHNKISIF